MIINLGKKLDLLEQYFSGIQDLQDLFGDRIIVGKPIANSEDLSLYFTLVSNSGLIQNDNSSKSTHKRAVLDFVIITNKKDAPDVDLYNAIDILSNSIVGKEIDLEGFKILGIQEGNQSGVVNDKNENPFIVAQYIIDYKSLY